VLARDESSGDRLGSSSQGGERGHSDVRSAPKGVILRGEEHQLQTDLDPAPRDVSPHCWRRQKARGNCPRQRVAGATGCQMPILPFQLISSVPPRRLSGAGRISGRIAPRKGRAAGDDTPGRARPDCARHPPEPSLSAGRQRWLPVPGEGPADAGIFVVGQAPEIEESWTGTPVCGAGWSIPEILRLRAAPPEARHCPHYVSAE
jgi:hypothetical protein